MVITYTTDSQTVLRRVLESDIGALRTHPN